MSNTTKIELLYSLLQEDSNFTVNADSLIRRKVVFNQKGFLPTLGQKAKLLTPIKVLKYRRGIRYLPRKEQEILKKK